MSATTMSHTSGIPQGRAIARSSLPPAISRTLPARSTGWRITLKRSAETKRIKRAMIISASYRPLLNPRAFRWSAIAEHWGSEQRLIDVIGAWAPGLERKEILSGVRVFRTGGALVERLRSKLRPSSRTTTVADVTTAATAEFGAVKLKNFIKSALRWAHDLYWKNLYWPDYACLWYFPALRQAEALLKERKYDTLITVSDPFTSHLIGRTLKKRHPQLNWLVDLGDPFSFREDNATNNFDLYQQRNLRIERDVFSLADSVTVTTESTRVRYCELFPGSADKIQVIGPLASTTRESDSTDSPLKGNSNYKLVFAGTLYRHIRNPHYLLKLYEVLLSGKLGQKLELHFFGGIDDCRSYFAPYESEFGKSLYLHGLVSREVVAEALRSADLLINIGNTNSYQLPSKVVEYAALGKPLAHLSSVEQDCSDEFLSSYPLALRIDSADSADDTKIANQARQIETLLSKPKPRMTDREIQTVLAPYTINCISERYLNAALSETRR